MSTTLYDVNRYSPHTINTFERVGAFIVGIYWDNLYQEAQKLHMNNKAPSVTEAYKAAVKTFLQSFSKPELYSSIIHSLHQHFMIAIPSMTYTEMINTIAREIIPAEYWGSFSQQRRDQVLGEAINKAASLFTVWAITPTGLRLIVDRPTGDSPQAVEARKSTINTMQDRFLQMMLEQREDCHRKLAVNIVGSVDVKVREDAKLLQDQTTVMRQKLHKAVELINGLEREKKYLLDRSVRVEQEKAGMQAEIDSLRRQLAEARQVRGPAPAPERSPFVDTPAAPITAAPSTTPPVEQPSAASIAASARRRKGRGGDAMPVPAPPAAPAMPTVPPPAAPRAHTFDMPVEEELVTDDDMNKLLNGETSFDL